MKGQASIELVGVVGIALVLASPFVVEAQDSMIDLAISSEDANFQASLNELEETVDQVSSSGEMSQRTFELQIPSNIDSVKTQQQALIFTQERGERRKNFTAAFETEINASGLSAETGFQELQITYTGGVAEIEPSVSPTVTSPEISFFDVSNIRASPGPVTEGEDITLTADVENTGDADGTQEIRLLINGSEEDTDSLILNQGESKQVEFNYTTSSSDRPLIEASVSTDDTSDSTDIQVEDSSEFTEQGLLIHLDAQSIEGLSEGESVERWNDSTANEFDATSPSVSESPTLSSSGINGVQSVEFDGSSSVLTIPHSSEMDMDNFQVFTVLKASSSDLTNEIGVIHNKQTSNTFNDRNWWLALDNGQGFAGGNGALGLRTSSGGEVVSLNADGNNYIDDNTYLVSAKVNSTEDEAELRINSSLKASASNVGIPEGEGAPIGIGAEIEGSTSTGFSRYFGGQIGEIMIYNETLSATQEQELENYLSNKWGITLS